jgi:formyltetrahydrofolate-dependent phosphoribosylglycinamide formyltransferase
MKDPVKVAVLVSGSGTNLQALLDTFTRSPESGVRVTRVIASRPGIGSIERARAASVPCGVLPDRGSGEDAEAALHRELEAADADLVVLAGFLKLIPESVVRAYRGRMINIHPALLPSFGGPGMYGGHVHEAVVRSGALVSGVTVHFVDEQYDRGAIIAQWPVPVREGDDVDRLAARVLRVEHRVLPAVVKAFAEGAFGLDEDGRCRWSRPWFPGETFYINDESDEEA